MIVVFGSINVDLVVRVTTLPRPGETVLAPGYAAVAAARAGAATHMIGRVGRDAFAEVALGTLRKAGVDLAGVDAGDAATGCAMICVDSHGGNQIAVASGANREARAAQLDDALLGPGTTLVLQLEVDPDETWAVIRRARARGSRVVLNTAPAAPVPSEIARTCDVHIMNEIEATMLAQATGLMETDPAAAARGIAGAWGVTGVVTLGKDGARAFDGDAAWRIGALPVTPVDTTAAGDAFVGVFAATLDDGDDLPTALRRASVAGSLACTKEGAQPSLPDAAAIDAALPDLAPAERI